MPLNKDCFVASLANGHLYYFLNSQFNSPDSHFHLCVHVRDNECVFLLCGTSRPESTTRFLTFNNIPYQTFVPVKPNSSINELSKDTYFHCNQLFNFPADELYNLYLSGSFRERGSIAEHELFNIKTGISISPILETNVINEVLTSFPDFD